MVWLESISLKRAIGAVVASCLLVYGLNLTHSFVWDDAYNIVQNKYLDEYIFSFVCYQLYMEILLIVDYPMIHYQY